MDRVTIGPLRIPNTLKTMGTAARIHATLHSSPSNRPPTTAKIEAKIAPSMFPQPLAAEASRPLLSLAWASYAAE